MSTVHPTPKTTTTSTTTGTTTGTTTSDRDGHDLPMVHRRFDVTGMTCAHCERAIASELRSVPGVVTVAVDARTGIVLLGCSNEPDRAAVAAAVHDAGYDLR